MGTSRLRARLLAALLLIPLSPASAEREAGTQEHAANPVSSEWRPWLIIALGLAVLGVIGVVAIARSRGAKPRVPVPKAMLYDLGSHPKEAEYGLKPVTKIGRDEKNNNIVIPFDTVSGYHAEIRFRDGQFCLCDLKSSNKTFLDGQALTPDQEVLLKHGSRIRFDAYEFEFVREDQKHLKKTVVQGVEAPKRTVVRGQPVGRAKDNDFQLSPDDPYVSGRHAYLEICPPSCRVRDLDSTNGTAVNGDRVTECDLKDGDLIEIGFTQLKVGIGAHIARRTKRCPGCGQLIEYLADEAEPERCWACAEVRQSVKVEPAQIEVVCWSCGSELTGQGNSDGRAEELRGTGVYTCAKCLPAPDEWAGTFIGDYEVVRLLGEGGMGAVYLVYHRPTARLWALKQMKDLRDPLLVKRFEREIRLMKALTHQNVVRFVDTGVGNDGKPHVVIEYVRTGCLTDAVLANGGPLEAGYAVELVCQVLDGLEYIHGQSVIHRDIKPPNILLHHELHTGSTRVRPKLADFGLALSYARAGGTRLTKAKTHMGSLMYSSPEQVRDPRTVKETADIYSLGVTLYYLLTGRYTFDFPTPDEVMEFQNKEWDKGKSLEQALRALMKLKRIMHPFSIILSEEPVPIRKRSFSIPRELAEVVDRAVRKDPQARFQSAAEFRARLQQAMGARVGPINGATIVGDEAM